MKFLIFRPAAAADVEDAYRWYEHQRLGLGDEFLAAVSTVIESLVTYPTVDPSGKFTSFSVQSFLPNYRGSDCCCGLYAWTAEPTTVAISRLMANHG